MATSTNAVATDNATVQTQKAHWPLSYRMQLQKPKASSLQAYGFSSAQAAPKPWWSHRLYRGPGDKEVEILYSKTKAQSEIYAKQFLDEPVIGFDMEWPWDDWARDGLQNKIGLIQIASEDKIALFHIGLHPGKTSEEIIAPTLKRILEDPKIGKVGVSVLNADFSRLSRFFGLKPKGAVEASHLYRLVKFGPWKPELVSLKLVSLAHQVQEQLGLPLYKGDVRTSNWSKPLSRDQIDYAASDAYAGFMLYKCMNAKRLAMRPTPPLPIHAEKYTRGGKASRDDPIILDVGDGTTITSEAFFGVKPAKSGVARTNFGVTKSGTSEAKPKAPTKVQNVKNSSQPLDDLCQALYEALATRRASLAETRKIQPSSVISDTLLESIARAQPCDTKALLAVKGIGKIQQAKFGDEWLEVITLFQATNGTEQPAKAAEPTKSDTKLQHTPHHSNTRQQGTVDSSSDSSPAFDIASSKTPQLHTGLSFGMAETKLEVDVDKNKENLNGRASPYDSDDSLPSLDFGSPSRQRISSGTKRKRAESPVKNDMEQTPQPLRNPLKSRAVLTQQPSLDHALSLASSAQSSPKQSAPLSPGSRIARSKLLALSKLVTRRLPARPATAPPIVSERTLDLIVKARPQTQDDLKRIPGIDAFILACKNTGMDLLKNVVKFVPPRPP